MNAESSDWKKFIPISDDLNSIYEEMNSLSKLSSFEESSEVLPPLPNRHIHIFGSSEKKSAVPHIEQQLNTLIQKYDNATSSTEVILDNINTSVQTLDTIYTQYDDVSSVTTTLHKECEEYISEEKSLSRVLDELQEPLSYFRDLNVMTNKIGTDSLYGNESTTEKNLEMEYDLYCEELSSMISRIFECLHFFRSHPSYKDSENYIIKYTSLLNRIYTIIRNKFTSLLSSCTNQIEEKKGKNELIVTSSPLYYYMTALSKSNASLISHILQIHSVVTVELEGDSCFELYCNSRNDIIISLLTTEIEKMLERDEESSSGSLDSLIRDILLLLINVCEMESEQYISFFNSTQVPASSQIKQLIRQSPVYNNSISTLLEEISMSVYEQVRPLILDVMDVGTLCDVVHMIKMEIIAGDVIKRNSFTSVIIPVIIKLEEDLRERIVYISHLYIDTTISNYAIKKEDVDYPAKLYNYYRDKRNKEFNIYATWFTPVQKVLRILSLLYTCIDYNIMADLTVEGIQAVLHSIQTATDIITSKQDVIDGELFRIKTLLILREQISPFDIHSTSTYLPFSETSLQDSVLYRLFKKAVPTINFINQDGLRLIEESLKKSTNNLIEAICRDVCDDSITLIQQYEQFMSQAFTEDKFPLEEEQVVNLISSFQDGVDRLEDIVGKIALYIDSPATQGILFAPIRRLLIHNTSHFKEILVHLKPNNFPRYLEQLTELENTINGIDATKFSHDNIKSIPLPTENANEQEMQEEDNDVDNTEVNEREVNDVKKMDVNKDENPEERKETDNTEMNEESEEKTSDNEVEVKGTVGSVNPIDSETASDNTGDS